MNVAEAVQWFFFGKSCLGCQRAGLPLDPWLCRSCREELEKCGERPLWPPGGEALCLFPMNPLTRRLVLGMKYGGMRGLAPYMVARSSVGRCGEGRQVLESWGREMRFVPVPVHGARMRERGYNQCDRVAGALAHACKGVFQPHLLCRRGYKESQTWLGGSARGGNVAGAFRVDMAKLGDCRDCVVVDDVYTTGSTTSACQRALLRAGMETVHVCTLVYEQPVQAALDWVADQALGAWEPQ